MIDLHTHTLFSDGELIPSELIRRAEARGLRAIALSDHSDMSTLDWALPRIVRACEENNAVRKVLAIPAVELTHVPPALIGKYAARARELGARLVLVHGESPVEPVEPGTNLAAIEAGVDILAHPGLITEAEVKLAAQRGVFLEITSRRGHSLTNGHVASLAVRLGAGLVLNSDAHAPGDLIDAAFARTVALGAGLSPERYARLRADMERLAGLPSSEDAR
jgi:histidinol phosphatase-like PHP family hydrolase